MLEEIGGEVRRRRRLPLKHREPCEERKETADAEVAHESCQNDIPIRIKKAIAHATKG